MKFNRCQRRRYFECNHCNLSCNHHKVVWWFQKLIEGLFKSIHKYVFFDWISLQLVKHFADVFSFRASFTFAKRNSSAVCVFQFPPSNINCFNCEFCDVIKCGDTILGLDTKKKIMRFTIRSGTNKKQLISPSTWENVCSLGGSVQRRKDIPPYSI